MKTTFISSYSVSDASRQNLLSMQKELTKLEKEVASNRVADVGLALGSSTGQAVSLDRDVNRLGGIIDSNSVVSTRLDATQSGLKQVADLAQSLMSSLTAAVSGQAGDDVITAEAENGLSSLTGILNTSLNGEYLFAGVNTDVRPINGFEDGSASRTAFNDAFSTYFGFAIDDAAASTITADQMNDFIDNAVSDQFLGADWSNWSNASDETITSRITLNETTSSSVSANTSGMRKLAMATATIAALAGTALSETARSAVYEKAAALVGEAVSDVSQVQARTGIVQQRVTNASDRLSTQIDIFKGKISDMEGIDAYEASTRVSNLLAQIETAYTLTARIRELSLVNYL